MKRKPVKSPSSVLFLLDLIEEPPKSDSAGFSELNKRSHFSGLAVIWLLLNQVKCLSDMDCHLEIIALVKEHKCKV